MSNSPMRRGWTMRKFGECGKWLSGGTPSKSNPLFWGGDIPWISAKSLKVLKLFDSEDRVTKEGKDVRRTSNRCSDHNY